MHRIVGRLSLLRGRPADETALPAWRAAGIAVLWTIATSLAPVVLLVLLGWLASGLLGDLADPIGLAINIWLTAHGVPLELAAGSFTLHPLGLTALVLALLWRGGRWAGRNSRPTSFAAAGRLVVQYAIGYGAVCAGLAFAANGPVAQADVVVAGGAGALLAGVVGGLGVLSGAELLDRARKRVPVVWRVAVDAGCGAALVLVGLAALLLAGVLAVRHEPAYDVALALGPDQVGWPLLLMINAMLVPNAVLAALAYATGPGFAIGIGSSVALGGAQVGALPPLSLLAAVPGAATQSPATYAVVSIPLLAGIAAGLLVIRRSGTLRPELCALAALAAGPVAGVLTMVAAWAASGRIGSGQLSAVGPTGWMVGAVVALEVGVVAAATAWIGCPRSRSNRPVDAAVVTAAPIAVPVAAVPMGPVVEGAEETVILDRQTG